MIGTVFSDPVGAKLCVFSHAQARGYRAIGLCRRPQASRVNIGMAGGLRHEKSDRVVGQQVNPKLLVVHVRCLTAQHIHACRGLEVSQVQLDVPASRIQRPEVGLVDPSMIEQRGHQDLVCYFDFAQRDGVGGVGVLLGRHPLGTCRRLRPAHDVVPRARRPSSPKVGDSRSVLLEQHVYDPVLATRHDAPAVGGDAQGLVAIDLAVLASAPERFAQYDADVRREYAWVPGYRYRRARRAVLQGFQDRPRIYATAPAFELLEAPARVNLTGALARLAQ